MPALREGAAELLREETIAGDRLAALAAKIPAWAERG